MPTFNYRGVNSKGESVSGVMDAPERRVVLQRMKSMQLRVTDVTAKGGTPGSNATITSRDPLLAEQERAEAAAKPSGPMKALKPEEFKGEKVALAFLKKLHQLHSGGMPLGDSIRLLSVRVTDPRQASLAMCMWKEISEGRTLANAMRTFPKNFDSSMIHLIEAGESTGNLVPVLDNLISHLEENMQLRKTIMGGLAYPCFVLTLAFGVLLLFLYFLLPHIQTMMASMGGHMNFMTSILIGISQGAVKYGPWVLIVGVITAVYIFRWRKTPVGRNRTDLWLLKLPFLSKIFMNTDICRVSNLCATLLESGLNTTETLRMTEKSVQNTIIQGRFQAARSLINDGASFSSAFKRFRVLPDLDLDLLAVGENTGNIAKSFREIYRVHSIELGEQFKLLTVLITSGALGLAFSLVAILAVSIVMSVLQMSKNLLHH